jgi:hypothetical protein
LTLRRKGENEEDCNEQADASVPRTTETVSFHGMVPEGKKGKRELYPVGNEIASRTEVSSAAPQKKAPASAVAGGCPSHTSKPWVSVLRRHTWQSLITCLLSHVVQRGDRPLQQHGATNSPASLGKGKHALAKPSTLGDRFSNRRLLQQPGSSGFPFPPLPQG